MGCWRVRLELKAEEAGKRREDIEFRTKPIIVSVGTSQTITIRLNCILHQSRIPKLLVNLHQRRHTAVLYHLRLDNKSGQKHQRLRLARILRDAVMTTRRLVPRLPLGQHQRRSVVHLVVARSRDDDARDGSPAVAVRRRGAAGRVGHG